MRPLAALALLWASLGVCWAPGHACELPQRAEPPCHQQEGGPEPSSCCNGCALSVPGLSQDHAPAFRVSAACLGARPELLASEPSLEAALVAVPAQASPPFLSRPADRSPPA